MIWRRRPFLFSSLPRLLPRSSSHRTERRHYLTALRHLRLRLPRAGDDGRRHSTNDIVEQARFLALRYPPVFSSPTTILWVSHTKKTAPHDCADGRASSGLLWRFFLLLGFCDCNASFGFVIFTTPGFTDGNLFDDDDDMNTLLVLLLLTHESLGVLVFKAGWPDGMDGMDGWNGMDGRREGVGDIIRAGPGYRYYYTGCLLAVSHTLVDIVRGVLGRLGGSGSAWLGGWMLFADGWLAGWLS
ncbi:hypothetical protein VTJ04DRAFT_3749 [Mycothermus thermophilus]|uniref:uncharacterized protein n=1 Tax=Humicola insolens TaxID=85995 RepID=UPI0037431A18